jgi:hypothetical protein
MLGQRSRRSKRGRDASDTPVWMSFAVPADVEWQTEFDVTGKVRNEWHKTEIREEPSNDAHGSAAQTGNPQATS